MSSNKFDKFLGFSASALAGRLTGGTQVGRAFSENERILLENSLIEIRRKRNNIFVNALKTAFDSFEEGLNEVFKYEPKHFKPKRAGPLFHLAAVFSLAVLEDIENTFNQLEEPIENMNIAVKLLCISFYFKEKSLEFNVCFEANEETEKLIPKTEYFENIVNRVSSFNGSDCINLCMKPTIVEEALQIMHCITKTKPSRTASFVDFIRPKFSSSTDKLDLTMGLESFTIKKRSKKTKKTKLSDSSYLKGSIKDARSILREIFSLSTILKRFRVNSPVVYDGREIKLNSVPQLFQTSFTSSITGKSSKNKVVSFQVIKDFSVVLYNNGTFEIFENAQQKSIAIKSIKTSATEMLLTEYDDYLVIAFESSIHLFDFSAPGFDEVRMFTFRGNCKYITAITSMAGYLYVAFEDGSIAMWLAESNKEMATFVHEDQVDVNVWQQYEAPVTYLSGDVCKQKIVSVIDNDILFLWKGFQENQSQKMRQGIDSKHGEITAICSQDGEVFTAGIDGCIRVWDIANEYPSLVLSIKRAHFDFQILEEAPIVASPKKEKRKNGVLARRVRKLSSYMGSFGTSLEKEPFEITSLAIKNDLLLSTGKDDLVKLWNLSELNRMHPVIIKKASTVKQVEIIENSICTLTEELDVYGLEGIDLESHNVDGNIGKKEISFTFGEKSENDLNDGQPTVVMNLPGAQLAQNSYSIEDLEDMNLATALKCSTFRKDFMKFLRAAHAEESLEFYIICRRFQRFFNVFPEKTRERESRNIIKTFIEIGSKKQVNISDTDRRILLANKTVSRTMFQKTVNDVYHLMDSNFFMAFKKETKGKASKLK